MNHTTIPINCFSDCILLEVLVLHKIVTAIGVNAFGNVPDINELHVKYD